MNLRLIATAAFLSAPVLSLAQQPGDAKPSDNPAWEARKKAEADALRILKKVGEFYRATPRARASVTQSMTIGKGDDKQEHDSIMKVAAERPNKFSVRAEGDEGYALVCDGAKLWTYMGSMFNKYTEETAPADFAGVMRASSFGQDTPASQALMMPHALLLLLMDGARFDHLIEEEVDAAYIGADKVGDKACERIRLSADHMAADLWVESGERPWLVKIVPDYSKAMEGMGEMAEGMKDRMPQIEITFTEWTSGAIPAEVFAFKPPAGAEKVDDLMEAMRAGAGGGRDEGAEHADLLGKPAPDLDLELLDGGRATLAEHKGKSIVMLDFWATWCPPCVKGLPIVAATAAKFKDKGVVFYAVNEQEPPATIRKFLEKKELKIAVALDKNGAAGNAFGVSGIPQTVLIAKDGTVQVVHVGLSPNLEEELTEQLNALVEGKTLAKPGTERSAKAPVAGAEDRMASQQVWSATGSWTAVAPDGEGGVYASRGRTVARFDRDGTRGDEIKGAGGERTSAIRAARLGAEGTSIVSFDVWGPQVRAVGPDGKELWNYKLGDGVDDVWVFDLDGKDGDGRDEVIIGYNGGTGLHVLNTDGSLRWKNTSIGNVWHVCAARTGEGGEAEVITTSAAGEVHIFNRDGKPVKTLRPGVYANLVRAVGGESPVIIAGSNQPGALVGLGRDGKKLWKAPLDEAEHTTDGAAAHSRPWLAVADRAGVVVVLDASTGNRLATIKTSGNPSPAWIEGKADEPPLLVIATGAALKAFKIVDKPKEGDAPAKPEHP